MRSFLKEHLSVIFIGVLIALGLVGVVLGFIWTQVPPPAPGVIPWQQPIGGFLSLFCGSLLAIGLTAVFISLPDLQNHLSGTIAKVLSGDAALTILSADTKQKLYRSLISDRVARSVKCVEPTLTAHVSDRSDAIFSSVYVSNFHSDTTLTPVNGKPGLILYKTYMAYRLHAQHLIQGKDVELVYEQIINYSDPYPIAKEEWLREFEIKAGTSVWKKEDMKITLIDLGKSAHTLRADFAKTIHVDSEVDVKIVAEFVTTTADPLDITRARYPSQGLHASLTFNEEYSYDCAWFKLSPPPYVSHDNVNTQINPNGIKTFTNDWLLPGEGVLLSFSKRNPLTPADTPARDRARE